MVAWGVEWWTLRILLLWWGERVGVMPARIVGRDQGGRSRFSRELLFADVVSISARLEAWVLQYVG